MSKFDLPMFQSKFLGACVAYLVHEHGLNDIVPFAKLRDESFSAGWDSGLDGDFPSFVVEDGGWSFQGRNDDGGVLMMDVFDRGGVVFRSLDGDSVYLKTRIEAPEELGEMMALFMSIKPGHPEAPHWEWRSGDGNGRKPYKWAIGAEFKPIPTLGTNEKGEDVICINPWSFTEHYIHLFISNPALLSDAFHHAFGHIFDGSKIGNFREMPY